MKIFLNKKPAVLLLLLCITTICVAQQKTALIKPVVNEEEQALKQLLAIATNPKENGLKLLDTISPNNKYLITFASTVKFPKAVGTVISSRKVYYKNGIADIHYTWSSLIKKIPQSDTASFNKRIGQLQEMIARVLPKVRDTFYTQKDYRNAMIWDWVPQKGYKLSVIAIIDQKYNLPNEVKLELTVNKSLKQDQKRVTDSLFNSYSKLNDEATSRRDAGSYCLSLFRILDVEGLPENEILTRIKPLFKRISNRDIGAGFDIIIGCPQFAVTSLQAELTPDQMANVRKLAQKLVNDFNATYYKKPEEKPAAIAKLKAEKFNSYYTNYKIVNNKPTLLYVYSRDTAGQYRVFDAVLNAGSGKQRWSISKPNGEKTVDDSHFAGGNWRAIHIGDCVRCTGTGIEIKKTPYTYYREEKGIYNKYTYSGSGYNVSSGVCSWCAGAGYQITHL